MSEVRESGEQYVYRICSFLISSASGLFQEPDHYGPLRLLLIFPMIVSLPDYINGLKPDNFLLEIKDEIGQKMEIVAGSKPDEQKELIKDLVKQLNIKLAKELTRRREEGI